ncbi:endonuclease/exonuclease/phosphatase family protein [Falsiroseomonas selenitidurans]|uniref:Endonuclease/exonuclease/phosphatase family protein n=1 Tax=Falsiroseomonas selenitidurans TaxID=2716335 RepID=A0ABX1ECX9_9PROT|nr:endonuclease/exonuclease/phosphatase family protein [Falsiroseomonas selenitidurans]NKC33747.1 endonuclease/exonuclease/phosphatase family protein [Falsiroseomonas selenitidurans]
MARNQRDIVFATFNLYNLQMPGVEMYPGGRPLSEAEFAEKIAWAGAALRRLDADVIGFQELWSPDALRAVFAQAGLAEDYTLHFIKDGAWDGIAVAAAVRKPWEVTAQQRHKAFPEGFRLRKGKRSMADIQADPPQADLAAAESGPPPEEDPETLPSHEDDGIEVIVREFSRSPLQLTLGHGTASRPGVPPIEVFCCHLKSKLPTRLDDAEYRDPAIRPHAAALGGALSTIRRLAEAAALRVILNDTMRRNDRPVVVLGDLNDGQFSSTLAVLSGQPSFRLFAASGAAKRSDDGLYASVALQQLRSLGDVYYTHEFRNVREVIDHVLVSEQFYAFSEKRLWAFREMRIYNDHVSEPQRAETDHGLVRAAFDWLPAR